MKCGGERNATYKEIIQNEIRFVLGNTQDTPCKAMVNKKSFPAGHRVYVSPSVLSQARPRRGRESSEEEGNGKEYTY